jgi:hypothetical protein
LILILYTGALVELYTFDVELALIPEVPTAESPDTLNVAFLSPSIID